ncbi:hypothetical protein B5M42_007730 [Paenibacillus athensensis]|uniref:Uncharacterized protein n=1 Tax=Paenibacillus athensensis TaxID=1967502 RepID=A0A4Y8Q4T5_9BACL|nr:hypothetical protein [Paenibacillus athensensis]MCD1258723.1 hypothetical protein [Paenibacillus athensensis]
MKEAYAKRRLSWLGGQRRQTYWLLLYLWGAQWVLAAASEALPAGRTAGLIKLLSLLAAAAGSAALLWRAWQRLGEGDGKTASAWTGRSLALIWPWVVLPMLVLMLQNTGVLSLLYSPLLGACGLAAAYIVFGRLLGSQLVWLGLWLLALTAIVGIWYLGYAGAVLEGMSGFSLLACGWLLRVWGKAAAG